MFKSVAGTMLTCMVVYLANGRPHPEVDCVAAPYTAWSLVRHGTLDLRPYPTLGRYCGSCIRELPEGSWVSMRPPGSALAAVPVVAPLALTLPEPLADNAMHHLGKLAAAFSVAAATGFFYVVCRRLAPAGAWPATILFGLGTCLCSVASQALWMHGPATFWLVCTLFILYRDDSSRTSTGVAAGIAQGIAVLTRPTTLFFALATGMGLLLQRRWRLLFGLTVGSALPLACLCLLNWSMFGDPFLGGYASDNWSESPPWWLGLGGLLVAPSRGVLVYSPALVLVPLGLRHLARRGDQPWSAPRAVLVCWSLAAALTVLFYARWHDWRGGWCYGPRFLCETMPILCLLFAIAYSKLRESWPRRLAVGLVGLSVAVHLMGIFGYGGYEPWQRRHDLPDQGKCLFSLDDTQIEAHTRAFLQKWTGPRS